MKTIEFADGTVVPALGQGSWHLGQERRPAAQEVAALRLGYELGLRLVDTAEMYGEGRAEELIAKTLPGERDTLYLVSKVYPQNARRAALRKACDASLRRLGVPRLDLYLLHWRGGADLAETVATFEELKTAGKIGAWGVSNFDVTDMEDLLRVPQGERCATNQVLYNVASRGIEFDLLPWCAARRMPVMAYSPLGSGAGLLRHPALREIAERHHTTTAALALAWAIRAGGVIAIPEAGDQAHVRTNAQALSLTLDARDLADLDAAFPPPRRKVPLDIL
ncbi:aldo/keto reductase [Robbsia sp. Bb-Pol-6]|uniref:Aldo/keto reductase n=2 Tax=Robbsia betulipollinis TaxID=2981849 RepID=A0ABT3ZPY2_9BURK|nr:aldo/keto reductase [Robbsia betulipollinis]MCY0387980.1 aldo/keto reductase [Robbsia betulipollinis]